MRKHTRTNAARDRVDEIVAEWREQRPDLQTAPIEIVGRLGRLAIYLDDELERFFAEHGITRATWDVIATLRRSGAPFKLTQTALLTKLMRTSGTMSVRIDRMEREGLVRREKSDDDRRATVVALTARGQRLFDEIARAHLANEDRLLRELSASDRAHLAKLLKRLLVSFERTSSS